MTHHGAGLRKVTNDYEFVKQVVNDYKNSPISDQEKIMLGYAVKLSLEPWNMEEADVQELSDAGFSNAGILDIVQVTGYYAYVNRLADGLGVDLEEFWEEKGNESTSK